MIRKLLFVVVLSATLNSCTEAQVIAPLFQCSDQLEGPYGVCAHLTRKGWDWELCKEEIPTIKSTGVNFVRSDWDYWNIKQDSKFGWLDETVDGLNRNKLQMLGILSTPWKSYPWKDPEAYNNFIKYNLQHFDSRVKYWEILNEINLTSKKDSLPIQYTNFLKEVYPAIKSINPDNQVLLSGLSETTDGFLEKLCKLQAYEYFDIFNFHSYYLPEDIPDHFRYIRKCMDNYGWEKPVWITELGMHTCRVKENWRTEDAQARTVARYHLIAFAYGVDKVFWYNFRSFEKDDRDPESHFGLTHKDLSPKPAFYAYITMTNLCPSGSTRPSLIKKGDLYLSGWKLPNGKHIWAIWNSKSEVDVKLKIKGSYSMKNYMGDKVKKNKKEPIRVSTGVTYIIGAKDVSFVD